jgi:hypothetical protein
MRTKAVLVAAAATVVFRASLGLATPVTYTDTVGDTIGTGGSNNGGRDIVSATVNDDFNGTTGAPELDFTIEFYPGGAIPATTETAANISTSSYDYAVAITTGSGGDTSTTNTGNPYTRLLDISAAAGGMTDFIGLFGEGGAGSGASPYTGYTFQDEYHTTGTAFSSTTHAAGATFSATGEANPNTLSFSAPLSDFPNISATVGTTIAFDIYSIGNSANTGVYDALDDPTMTSSTVQYDDPTGSSSANPGTALSLESYTFQTVPEPATLGILAISTSALLLRRRAGGGQR